MKGTSLSPIPFVQNDGINLTISFNEKVTTETDGQKTYEYDTVVLPVTNNYLEVFTEILNQCPGISWVEARNIARKALGIDPELEDVKEDKVAEIDEYDKSNAVNSFTLGGQQMWLPLEERKSMRQSLIALKAQGIETFTYWNGLTPITMPVAQFEAIMNAVEVYALQCYNTTARHKANVMALTTIAEIEAYDITADYPDKLEF